MTNRRGYDTLVSGRKLIIWKEEQNMAKTQNVIRQFNADNVPNAIANHVKVVASDILVVPTNLFENIIKVLVAKNLPYQIYTRKNDIIIAILLKGV